MSEPLVPQTASPDPLPVAPVPVAPEPASGGGFFQNLVDVFVAPREAFTRIVRRPSFWLPAIGWLLLTLGFTAIWMSKMDPREFMKTQLEESGQWDKIPGDQREQILESSAGRMKTFGWIGPVVFTPLMLVVVAGVLMGVYRFFYAAEMTYRQALAICAWAFFAVALLTTPLLLLVMNLKGDWNLNPQNVVQANPSVLFEKDAVSKPLYALLSSIDLFSIWTVFLLASGFAVASRKKTSAAIWGVAVPWLLIVLWKVGWAAIF